MSVRKSITLLSLENARLYANLLTSEERWRNLFENVPVGVALVDSRRRYVAANPAFQGMTGYSESELQCFSPADIIHEDDRAARDAGRADRVRAVPAPVADDPVTVAPAGRLVGPAR
jgi:PAS domain-containing protein